MVTSVEEKIHKSPRIRDKKKEDKRRKLVIKIDLKKYKFYRNLYEISFLLKNTNLEIRNKKLTSVKSATTENELS